MSATYYIETVIGNRYGNEQGYELLDEAINTAALIAWECDISLDVYDKQNKWMARVYADGEEVTA